MEIRKNVKTGAGFNFNTEPAYKDIVLAGGCFWGTAEFLRRLPGVNTIVATYANGNRLDPSYELVCSGKTDHVEAVYTVYDPKVIDLKHLLYYFFQSFDPSQKDRQGNDLGRQYRNGIYYLDAADLSDINYIIKYCEEKSQKNFVTEVLPLDNISLAEDYHQDYLIKNPRGYCHVDFRNLPAEGAILQGDNF